MLIRDTLQVPYVNSGSDVALAGTGVQVGDAIFGVLETNLQPGETGVLAMTGIWTLPIATSTTADAGDIAYWDKSGGKVLASGASKLAIGVFTKGSANGETETEIAVFPTVVTSSAT